MYYFNEVPNFNAPLYGETYSTKNVMFKRNLLRLEGLGSVKTSPDLANIFLGVISEANKLTEAQQENTEKMNNVINSILQLGVGEKNIKTENYSVDPQYDFVEGKQIFRGYRVTNNIRVTVRDMQTIGKIIDRAIESGANVVYNVNFSLADRDIYYRKALSLALVNALQKTKSIEKTLAVEVNTTPVEIVEEGGEAFQPREAYSIKAPASQTPIMSGEIEVTAKVNVSFRYVEI